MEIRKSIIKKTFLIIKLIILYVAIFVLLSISLWICLLYYFDDDGNVQKKYNRDYFLFDFVF